MNIIVYLRSVICMLFIGLGVLEGETRTGSSDIWTLESAINRALAVNSEVMLARHELEYQTGMQYQVRASVLPQVNLSSRVSFRDQSTIDRSAAEFEVAPSNRTAIAQKSYSVGVEFRQLLFDGLSSVYKVRQQNFSKQASFWKLKNVSYRVVALVRQSYDSILYHEAIVSINKKSVRAFEELYRMEGQREILGEGTVLGTLQVQTQLNKSKAKVAQAKADLIRSEEKFRQLLQLDGYQEREHYCVEGNLVKQEQALGYDEAMRRVGNFHPDIVSAKLERDAAKANLRSAQLSYFPKIEGVVQYDVKSSYYDSSRNLEGWTIGFQGKLPLFDGFRRSGMIKSARAGLDSSEVRLKQKRIQLSSRVRELYGQVDSLVVGVESKESSVGFGMKALRESERLYSEGEITIKEVLEEELSLRSSQRELQDLILELNSLIYQLEYILVSDDNVRSRHRRV